MIHLLEVNTLLEKIGKKELILMSTAIVVIIIAIILSVIASTPNEVKETDNRIGNVVLKAILNNRDILILEVQIEEKENVKYYIEKSININFTDAEEVEGTNNTPRIKLTKPSTEDTIYYRVKAENTVTNEIVYSNVISVSKKENESNVVIQSTENIDENPIDVEERKTSSRR